MILVTRLNGQRLALNCDMIQRIESTPDTHVFLNDGSSVIVRETVEEVVDKVREFKASITALADHLEVRAQRGDSPLRVVPDPDEEG